VTVRTSPRPKWHFHPRRENGPTRDLAVSEHGNGRQTRNLPRDGTHKLRRALREAMELPAGQAETARKRKEPARRETRISFSRSPQELDKLRRRAERRKALGLDP
jgi:hypothetical protein